MGEWPACLPFTHELTKFQMLTPGVSKKMMSFRGQASWAKTASLRSKLIALVCHQTKKVNKPEKVTQIFTNSEYNHKAIYLQTS
jgi:hypothetical protein